MTTPHLLAGRRARRGFSIIELLVAIIIIGILVTVLVPIVSSRAEQARVARAEADLENLSEAMQRVAVDTGYYVRLFALDDVLRGDGDLFGVGGVPFQRPRATNDVADGLTDHLAPGGFFQFPDANSLFIDPATGLFAGINPTTLAYQGAPTRQAIIQRLVANESRYDPLGTWQGPYLSFRSDNNLFNGLVAPTGIPDDPWGNDYLLFTRSGHYLEPNGVVVTSVSVQATGGLTAGGPYDCLVFDRATIVSMGPNGLPGNGAPASTEGLFGRGDDFSRAFGGN